MSFHNKPDYHIPELIEALKAHRLPHDTPSQLADSFRSGWMACRELAQADSVQEDAARYRLLRRGRHLSVIDIISNDLLRAEALDTAVDAVLKQEEKP